MTDSKPAPKYIYELTDAAGALRYVEARNKEQAIAHVFRPSIRTLSARDAVTIARNPNIVVETASEKPANQELPLAVAPEHTVTQEVASVDPTVDSNTTAAPPEIVAQAPADEPASATLEVPAKKGLFGRKSA